MSNQNNQTTTNNQTSTRRPRTCSVCKQSGHDKRNCPAAASLALTPQESRCRPQNISRPIVAQVDMNSCIYCVFDLETTGFSRNYHDIIEICGILLDARGNIINEDISIFHSLARPSKRISPVITGITGISDDTVATAPSFQEVGRDFIQFLKDNCTFGLGANIEDDDSDDDTNDDGSGTGAVPSLRDIVLVAHNGNRFDFPFLFHSFQSYGVDFHGLPLKGKIDTLDLVKHTIRSNQALRVPENYQLRTLYKYVTGEELSDSHRAESDAKATLQILMSQHFWDKRHDVMKPIIINEHGVYRTPTSATIDMVEDSDTDEGSDLDISDDEEDEDDIIYDNV
jgi:DNA polymerase III epsilon subunit-like protein